MNYEFENRSRQPRTIESVKFEGTIGRETDKAIQFTFADEEMEDGSDTTWFPLSQVVSIHRTKSIVNNTKDSIVVSMWIAKQKGLR